jgi:hypothetical protein
MVMKFQQQRTPVNGGAWSAGENGTGDMLPNTTFRTVCNSAFEPPQLDPNILWFIVRKALWEVYYLPRQNDARKILIL